MAPNTSKHLTIIWDWNGTLLDDVEICLESINQLLELRSLAKLSKDRYKEVFTFPVKNYYEMAGFDFSEEPFDQVAMEFIALYKKKIRFCKLFPEVINVMQWFKDQGYTQYMISAMEHELLVDSVRQAGIDHFLADLSGVSDHYANGKTAMAKQFCQKKGIRLDSAVFIGDTLHDFHVARELGVRSILVSAGHQSHEKLEQARCPVVHDLSALLNLFKNGLTFWV